MSTLWTPDILSGNVSLWLDAFNSASITTVSGVVSQWADLSGNARHATQTTATMRPAVLPYDLNGKNVMQFASTSSSNKKSLTTPEFMSSANPSVFLVAKSLSPATLAFFFSDAGPTITTWLYVSASSGNFIGLVRDSASQIISASHNSPAGLSYFVGSYLLRPPNCTTRHNGLSQTGSNGSYNASTVWTGTNTPPTLGWQAGTGWYATVNIAELIVINDHTVADANYEKIEGYLAWKWGLNGNLAAGHPYKNSAPVNPAAIYIHSNLTVAGNGAGDFVAIIDATTKELVTLIEPDANGDWSAYVLEGEYYIIYFGTDNYGSVQLCNGPYTITA